jgi:hypothetical protein
VREIEQEALCIPLWNGDHSGPLAGADAGQRPASPPRHVRYCSGLPTLGPRAERHLELRCPDLADEPRLIVAATTAPCLRLVCSAIGR